MTTYELGSVNLVTRISKLKSQQQSCMSFLMECITARTEHPEFAERLDVVIESVEKIMSQNAALIARLENEVRFSNS